VFQTLGHVKLSDFGLATGFSKYYDSAYYKRLLESVAGNRREGDNVTEEIVDYSTVGMGSRRDKINTWKKNRRALAYSTVGTPDYIAPEGKVHIFLCRFPG
jgi:protein-serine/threonine kinase